MIPLRISPVLLVGVLLILLVVVSAIGFARIFVDPPVELDARLTAIVPHTRRTDNKSAIIFMHGIAGHYIDTWKASKSPKSWPDLLRDDSRFKSFDLYSISYDTHRPGLTIPDLLDRLRIFVPEALNHYQDTYFVAHSLGGIALEKFLTQLLGSRQESDQRFVKTVKLVIFLSTPSEGDWLAHPMRVIAQNPIWDYLANGPFLEEAIHDWRRVLHENQNIEAFCASERLKLGHLWMVSEASARQSCVRQYVITSIYADHVSIAKPQSCSDDQYDKVAVEILARAHVVSNMSIADRPAECWPRPPHVASRLGVVTTTMVNLLTTGIAFAQVGSGTRGSLPPLQGSDRASSSFAVAGDRPHDFRSLQQLVLEQKNPADLRILAEFTKPDSPSKSEAIKLVADLYKRRDANDKYSDFYSVLARMTQDMGLSMDTPFMGSDLKGANLSNLDLRHVNFQGADLTGANFIGTNLEKANLRKACLKYAKFIDSKGWAWLDGANLAGSDLSGALVTWEALKAGGKVTVGLARTYSIESSILSATGAVPREKAAARGAVFTASPGTSPCR